MKKAPVFTRGHLSILDRDIRNPYRHHRHQALVQHSLAQAYLQLLPL
jgi:hypothetical protein